MNPARCDRLRAVLAAEPVVAVNNRWAKAAVWFLDGVPLRRIVVRRYVPRFHAWVLTPDELARMDAR